ncbi:transferrin-binding protein-like solute binding protein [Neisseria meningitidis]|uniref:transferrin-binding protein-like solute binding protein n=1 Tax=Neisseria meningitidis TaxID=487 RepID=UPI001C5745D1|nr:transferrin-binding protein-like solute binding protein [Neisseria meningitidis]MBW3989046.1 transferrin-binding protein-like solute binding protein [Neisseria meningitidis]
MCKPNYGGIVLLPLLLASCIGGNFGVQPVVESTPTAYPVTFKSKDVPTPPPAGSSVETTPVNRPAVGAAMRLPRRNIASYKQDGTEIPDKHQAEEHLPLKEKDILFLDGTLKEQADKLKKKINERYSDVRVITSKKEEEKYQYQFVRAGYVFTRAEGKDNEKEKTSDGKEFVNRFSYDGFVYYSGERPSQSLPSAGTVQYSGNWQYMTDAKRHRTGKAVSSTDLGYTTYYGNEIGATSYEARDADDREKHPAEYTVDFDNKTLNGKLIKNQYVQNKSNPNEPKKPLTIYDITATLDGNRFTGSAKVNTEVKTNHADKEYLFFHADADQRLEGGFFGDNGEELAGRFISNDNSVFGVFAGKKTETANAADTKPALPSGKHTKILDSLKISVDEATDGHARKFAISSMPDFGHPDKLLVEGREISLLKDTQTIVLADGREMTVRACCDFLTYVKLGRIKTDRPASKPKAEDKGENEEGAGVDSVEEGEDEIDDEDEVSEEDAEEIEEEAEEEEAEADEADEPEEAEETKEKSPTEEGNGGSGSILPALEAPKGRGIDLFLKGIRTAEADIPQTGKAHYIGTWEARIGVSDKKDNPLDSGTFIQKDNYANQGAKAQFTVDFGAKSLSGKLTEKNDTHPAFYIEKGVIDGNGFHALARTRENGVDLSGQGSTNPQSFKASNLLVEGGFYGPQAAELGGNIIDSDRKIGVVFGAKKDMQEVEK